MGIRGKQFYSEEGTISVPHPPMSLKQLVAFKTKTTFELALKKKLC